MAGDIGPISELCDDGVEGRFWPLDDPVKAAATLIDLLDSEPARLMAANAARERFRRDFDAEVVAPRLRSFLLGLHPPASEGSPVGSSSSLVTEHRASWPSAKWVLEDVSGTAPPGSCVKGSCALPGPRSSLTLRKLAMTDPRCG